MNNLLLPLIVSSFLLVITTQEVAEGRSLLVTNMVKGTSKEVLKWKKVKSKAREKLQILFDK